MEYPNKEAELRRIRKESGDEGICQAGKKMGILRLRIPGFGCDYQSLPKSENQNITLGFNKKN